MGRKTITDLPRELVDEVIAYLSDDPFSLASCSLTHPSWTDAAQSHIFRAVLYNSYNDTAKWLQFLMTNPRLASHIKALSISVHHWEWLPDRAISGLTQYTPTLTHLVLAAHTPGPSLGPEDCLAISQSFPCLARLRLNYYTLHPAHLATLLRPGVRELELCYSDGGEPGMGDFMKSSQRACWQKLEFYGCHDSTFFDPGSDRDTLEMLLKDFDPRGQTVEKLESVTIQAYNSSQDAYSILPILPKFTSLRAFSLYVQNDDFQEWTSYGRAWFTHVLDCVFTSPHLELVTFLIIISIDRSPGKIDRCYPWEQLIQILASKVARPGVRKPVIRVFVYPPPVPDGETAHFIKNKFSALRDIEVVFSYDDYREYLHQGFSIAALNQTRKEYRDSNRIG